MNMLGIERDPSWFKHNHLPYKIWLESKTPEMESSPHSPQMRTSRMCLLGPCSSWTSSTQHGEFSFTPPVALLKPFLSSLSLSSQAPLLLTPAGAGLMLFIKNLDNSLPTCKLSHSSLAVVCNVLYSSLSVTLRKAFPDTVSNDTERPLHLPKPQPQRQQTEASPSSHWPGYS